MRSQWFVLVMPAALLPLQGCASQGPDQGSSDPPDASVDALRVTATLPSSESARAITRSLRSRFVRLPLPTPGLLALGPAIQASLEPPLPVLPEGVASRFERVDRGLRPVIPERLGKPSLAREARVILPERADGEVRITDDKSGMQIGFALERASSREVGLADGLAVYDRGGPFESAIIHRPHFEGTEDFVVFETRPPIEELSYSVDVSQVPGLRLVADTLEFVSEAGSPTLRIAPPYVAGSDGETVAAHLTVEGCHYDTNPAPPWDREVAAPGASRCTVKVSWKDVKYPAVVDPAWGTTGSMATGRRQHTASLLSSSLVLVAGGIDSAGSALASAELFNPTTTSWAGTASMAVARYDHVAVVLSDNRVLVSGGQDSTVLASTERYKPTAPVSWSPAGVHKNARARHTVTFNSAGYMLAAGGTNGTVALDTIEKSADVLGTGAWYSVATMITPRHSHTATRITNTLTIFAGGYGTSGALAEVESLAEGSSPASEDDMTYARYDHVAWFDGALYVAGGFSSSTAKTEKLASSGGTWTNQGAFNVQRKTTVFVPGFEWAIGGYTGTGYVSSVERFNAGSWVNQLPLTTARGAHTATKLADGRLLVTGGRNGSYAALASAELHAAQAALGATCIDAGDCLSGICRDEVCCNTICSGTCNACTAALKGYGADGYCGPISANTDPDNECPNTQPETCGYTGWCNGNGACEKWPSGTSCGTPTCTESTLTKMSCNGLGACISLDTECTPFACSAGLCKTSCGTSADCAANYYCANAYCVAKKNLSTSCQTAEECSSGHCIDGVCCESSCGGGIASDCQSCNASQPGFCKAVAAGVQCRASAGACDVAEQCDGSLLQCPEDGFVAVGTVCRGSAGECDLAELCSGNSAACPNNVFKGAGTACTDDGLTCTTDLCNGNSATCVHAAGNVGIVCRPAVNECDYEEKCTGATSACPTNIVKASNTACTDDSNVCTTDLCNGVVNEPECVHAAGNAGAVCRTAVGVCDQEETCSGASTACPTDAKKPSSFVCRAVADACDRAENCDGTNDNCPADGFSANTVQCRSASCSSDVATLAANCPGNSAACPAPVTQSCSPSHCNGTICGGCSTDSECQGGYYCSGGVCTAKKALGANCSALNECVSAHCADGVCCTTDCNAGLCDSCTNVNQVGTCSAVPANTVCRPAAGACDLAETCGGAMVCPNDAKVPANTECLADPNPCTKDICDGSSNECTHPAGNAGTQCRAANGSACDVADFCNGTTTDCADAKQPNTYTCRTVAGECDIAEKCTGTTDACPDDAKKTAGTACAADSLPCTRDICDGVSAACQHPAGNAGTECRAADGVCDVADKCDGTNTGCTDNKQPNTFVCRSAAGVCDLAEKCDGLNNTCPNDARVANGTPCAADTNPCTSDICDGTNVECQHPAGNGGTVCRASAGTCDKEDVCSGSSTTCTDSKQAAGTVCRVVAGTCDVAESCSGTTNDCPADAFQPSSLQCRDPSCTSAVATLAANCTGSSANCPDPQTQSCAPSVCNGDQCGGCANDNECGAGKFCSGGVCTDKWANGHVCSGANQCSSGNCVDGVCCNTACSGGVCDSCALSGSPGTCSPVAASTVCRPSVGECDVAETCGGGLVCPTDATKNGQPCTADENLCTTEVCQGTTCAHVAAPNATVCRPANGECDVAETCGGATDCPADGFKTNGTDCTADDKICTLDQCTDGVCAHPAGNAGTECKPAAGECDVAESCDGTNPNCPSDAAKPDKTLCTLDGNLCTDDWCIAGSCTHPAGKAGNVCKPANGDCDLEEVCDGITPSCPNDATKPNGTACKDDDLPCTEDKCESGLCVHPAGNAGTVCRAPTGDCDIGESCTGSSSTCPNDAFAADSTACGDDGQLCTRDECHGGACVHPSDDGATCNDYNGCTQDDKCSASQCVGTQVPGCTCTLDSDCADPNVCNGSETCSSGSCVSGVLLDCDDANPCTDDACDPTSGCVHVSKADGATCSDGKYCRVGDECNGGVCAGTADRDCSGVANGSCQVAKCDEASMSCIAEPLPNGTACDDESVCTINDKCTSGACVGLALIGCKACVLTSDCDDGNECTTDLCDETTSRCFWAAIPNCTPEPGPEPQPEAGVDTGVDAPADTAPEATADVTPDVAPDALEDATPDVLADVAADTLADQVAADADSAATDSQADDVAPDQDAAVVEDVATDKPVSPDQGAAGAAGSAGAAGAASDAAVDEETFTREAPSCSCRTVDSGSTNTPIASVFGAMLLALGLRRRRARRVDAAEERKMP